MRAVSANIRIESVKTHGICAECTDFLDLGVIQDLRQQQLNNLGFETKITMSGKIYIPDLLIISCGNEEVRAVDVSSQLLRFKLREGEIWKFGRARRELSEA